MQYSVFLQLNITGHCHGPSVEETKDLWVQADIDGNGVVDRKEFQVTLMELRLRCWLLFTRSTMELPYPGHKI